MTITIDEATKICSVINNIIQGIAPYCANDNEFKNEIASLLNLSQKILKAASNN